MSDPPLPARSGKPWDEDEDRRLAALWAGGATVGEIAAAFERKIGGIASRLAKLDIVDDYETVRSPEARRTS